MENNYCTECGNKLGDDSIFCPECGFKIRENEKKTKFCSQCGEKIDAKAEICPNCGVRLMNPFSNSAGNALNKSKTRTNEFFKKYVTLTNIIIIVLVIIIIGLLMAAPDMIEQATPYKEVDSSYISNPVPGEKVQFDAIYVGTTSWDTGGYLFYYNTITNNDIVKVGDEYVIIQGDCLSHDLYGNEGKKIHLEGRFAGSDKSKEPTDSGYIYGRWFGADKIEIVN